ncbi:MAG TPA: exodeoxyribonuclease V subunit beta [Chitinispirillaceae bacterium]|nr:exodeoxyribonuclease V subunit beta [Chitinispirillaceae bacterium]
MSSFAVREMSTLPQFNLLNTSLSGHILIEASAGTGKTYTISRLFLRLLIEKEYPPSSILVVTFTDAAAGELKERIYLLIREALKAYQSGSSDDPFLESLIAGTDPEKANRILQSALYNFNTAAIYTIHGFCQKVLYENSFESGAAFESTIITDQNSLIQEIIHDYWRINFYSESPSFLAYAIQTGIGPQTFIDLTRAAGRSSENLKIVPVITDNGDFSREETAFNQSFQELNSSWEQCRNEIRSMLEKGNLKATKYSQKIIQELVLSMDTMLKSGIADPNLFERFENFTPPVLAEFTKKGFNAPQHAFFNLCEKHAETARQLTNRFDSRITKLQISFLSYLNQELTSRKRSRGQLFFDDLLRNVHSALANSRQSKELAARLREIYRVALIDEFQDTDSVQYNIFSIIFDNNLPLFMIGDPKQSIYGFRGADIFTYLQASQQVAARYTLLANYRSDPSFLSALNTLFLRTDNQFVYEKIEFHEAEAGKTESQQIVIEGVNQPSLNFIFMGDQTDSSKKIDKNTAICSSVTSEVSRLISMSLQNKASIGSRQINPSDIAVLVRTNREAEMIQQSLSSVNIPSVIDSGSSVFETTDAVDLGRLLTALLEPTRSEFINAVLASPLFGLTANRIEELSSNQQSWENYAFKFLHYHDLWRDHGFMYMFRHFLAEEHIRPKLLTLEQGERHLTNILHLSELLHLQEKQKQAGMTKLHSWFLQKITDNTMQVTDEEMLRLESDKDAVTIITIHKSKGLEYPIVFCPFWHNSELPNKAIASTFHDPQSGNEPVLAIGTEELDRNRQLIETELLAENMRLLYVALTRAKSNCYVVWGKLRGTESSALAYLLHKNEINDFSLPALKEKLKSLSADQIKQTLKEICNLNPAIAVLDGRTEPQKVMIRQTQEKQFSYLKLGRAIPESWRISSFSSLTKTHYAPESPDYDFTPEFSEFIVKDEKKEDFNIFNFPRGSNAGTFLHSVFEKTDFSDCSSVQAHSNIESLLDLHQFDSSWKPVISQLVTDTLNTPLKNGSGDFKLSEISKTSCRKEMEFYFPLKKISPPDLQQIFSGQVQTDLFMNDYHAEGLQFSPSYGFMKGYIDLIFESGNRFYLLDWKSNHLGNRYEDYHPDSLKEVMKAEHYILQYHIYLTALDKYLELRYKGYSYQKNFGGVYYVFLRGIDGKSENGIYFDRPEEKVVRRLREVLVG